MPNLPGMMLATLNALREMGGSANLDELDERVIETAGIGEVEQSYLMPDGRRPRVNYYFAWARTYLGRGHALINSRRGVWSLSELGEKVTAQEQCEQIYAAVNLEERERARQKRLDAKSVKEPLILIAAPLLDIFAPPSTERDERDWKSRLLDVVNDMSADGFERLAQRLMREAGFVRVEVRGKTGDGGIDGVGILRVNLVSFQVYFNVKNGAAAWVPAKSATFEVLCRDVLIKGCLLQLGHLRPKQVMKHRGMVPLQLT